MALDVSSVLNILQSRARISSFASGGWHLQSLSCTSEIEVDRKRSRLSAVIPGIDEKGILAKARIAQSLGKAKKQKMPRNS